MKKKEKAFIILFPIMVIIAIILRIVQYFDTGKTIEEENTKQIVQSETYCTQDTDCILVDANPCCTCESGGVQIAINKNYQKEWEEIKQKEKEQCKNTVCIELYACIAQKPKCENNQCVAPSIELETFSPK